MPVKILIFLLAIAGMASAETRTYVIKRAKFFPQDKLLYTPNPTEYKYFIETGKKDIEEANGQPFRLTKYEITPSGNYSKLTITPKNDYEKNRYDKMEEDGEIILVSTADVKHEYDERIGGFKDEFYSHKLAEYPTDYYEVSASTE